jgi:osmotically-inducible protein OsmY
LAGVVNWEFQQRAATDSVRFLAGVRGVTNDIFVKPTARPEAVKDAIEKALVRNAAIDAENVKVDTAGGAVTLSGSVRSWGDRYQAAATAWNAPGVDSVRNDINVEWVQGTCSVANLKKQEPNTADIWKNAEMH